MSIININRNLFQNFLSPLSLIYLGRISVLAILLHNQGLIELYNKNLFYFIIIFSVIHLIYSILLKILNIFVKFNNKNTNLFKNNTLNLIYRVLNILGLLFILYKIYINNSEYLILSEVFLYFFFYFLISCLMAYSKNLIFKTEIFKGISILNLFNVFRLSASNISSINTEENKDNVLDIKENIDIKSDIANNTTNIGLDKHAEEIIKQGVIPETISKNINKTIESGIAQAVPQIGLAASIGAGLSAGAKISAGQPPIARIATTTSMGIAGAGIQIGGTALNMALNQLPTKTVKENIESPPSPGDGFINSSNEEIINNPVELLLYSIWVLQFVILILLVVLLITFISKLILSLNYEFNWLNNIFSEKRSVQIRTFILKYFYVMSKIREFNIIVLIIVLIIISLFSLYFFSVFLLNLEGMCKLYLKDGA